MNFYDVLKRYQDFDFNRFLARVSEREVLRAIEKDALDEKDFLALLSPAALPFMEHTARRARELTLKHFGKVICLYAPLYLGNFCDNECVYCGFKHTNPITRRKLSPEEVEREAGIIARTGIRHLLVLTGESRKETPVSYLGGCIGILKKYFTSLSIEVYPLRREEYAGLIDAGVDGLTIYQETYDEGLYGELHPRGPKSDFRYRLEAPGRACEARMRSVSVGALLGLADFARDGFFTGLHAFFLQDAYPAAEISVSLPRIQPQVGNFSPRFAVTDRNMVQLLIALRLFMPRAGINVSTRERNDFRKNLIGLGVTRLSAGSKTEVGGYSLENKSEGQFSIADNSSVEEVKEMIRSRGYHPVSKDWQALP